MEFSLEDMDMSGFQKGATYGQIKKYVKEQTGLSVYIRSPQDILRPEPQLLDCTISSRFWRETFSLNCPESAVKRMKIEYV